MDVCCNAVYTELFGCRFWLMDRLNIIKAAKMATELHREAIPVLFMAKFVLFC